MMGIPTYGDMLAVHDRVIPHDCVADRCGNGSDPRRTSDTQITLFDGTGVGLQDLAVAAAVVDMAVESGIAIEVVF